MLTVEEFSEYLQIAKEKGAGEEDAVFADSPFSPPCTVKKGKAAPGIGFHIGFLNESPAHLYATWMQKSRDLGKDTP